MNQIDKFLLYVISPGVVICALLEALVLSHRGRYDWRAFGVSTLDFVVRIALNILIPFSLAGPFIVWAVRHRITHLELDGWLAFLSLFLGQEFFYYWYHRAGHRIRWFWNNHAVHHSPNELNLSAAFRIGIFSKITGTAIFFIPLIWMGFSPEVVFATLSFNLLYQFWIHATWVPKLGFLEGIINTPSAHRVHHASNLEYLDANYGGVLLIFDRMFGTYTEERAEIACCYGLVEPMRSNNPIRVEFLQWHRLVADLRHARSLKEIAGYLFMPPGWAPDDRGTTTENLRAQKSPLS